MKSPIIEMIPRCLLGPVDKPVLAPVQPERLGRCNTDVATG
jgi:hypothetical protein